MADQPVTLQSIYRLVGLLEVERVVYAFVGGVALNTWAIPRATFDLDLAADLDPDAVPAFLRKAEKGGFVLEREFLAGFRDRVAGMDRIHFFLTAPPSLLTIDVYLAQTPFLRSLLSRRTAVDLGEGPVHVCSAADLLLLKLVAGRPKDHVDVRNIVAVQGLPEPEYLRRFAPLLHVESRLRPYLEQKR